MVDGQARWKKFPGPVEFRPEEVEASLHQLAQADSRGSAQEAYNRVLSAIGNNHRGTLYPAAVGIIPILVEIAKQGRAWARWGALEVLVDVAAFEPEIGFETVASPQGPENLHAAVMRTLKEQAGLLHELAAEQSVDQDSRAILTALLHAKAFSSQ
jgi:hypothetical protein